MLFRVSVRKTEKKVLKGIPKGDVPYPVQASAEGIANASIWLQGEAQECSNTKVKQLEMPSAGGQNLSAFAAG